MEILNSNDVIIIESGSLSFSATPEIELIQGNIAGNKIYSILGGSETPKLRVNEASVVYIVNLNKISDLISIEQLNKEQEKIILTKLMHVTHSNAISSINFQNLLSDMYSRFKVNF